MLANLARFSYRRRRLVLLLWVVALVGVVFLSAVAGADSKDNFALPGTDSQRAYDLLAERFPAQGGDSAYIVLNADKGVNDPAARTAFEALLDKVKTMDHVVAIDSPYAESAANQVSDDGKIAFAEVHFDKRASEVPVKSSKAVLHAVEDAKQPGLQFEAGGAAMEKAEQPTPGLAEATGLVAAIIILLIAFGSVLAMGLPILTALFGIGIGISLIALFGHLFDVPSFAPQVASMIGIGVGIDYALLVVTRYRDSLHSGHSPEDAVHHAANTAGRSVVFAGTVVVISLLGLLLMNFIVVRGVSISAAAAVLVTMLAATTLLPAMLGFAGRNIDKWSLPHGRRARSHKPLSYRWSRVVQRRPWPAAILGAIVLIVLSLPLFGMRLGSSDQGNNPEDFSSRKAYDLLADGFGPGFNGPFLVVVDLRGSDAGLVDKLVGELNHTAGIQKAFTAGTNEKGDTSLVTVIPTTAPQDEATDQLVHHLRDDVVPSVVAGTNAQVSVGGITASFTDFADKIGKRLPVFIGAVIILSFLLLTIVFRSLLVPLKAAIMNLLSIGAAYGVIVAVFQWGWLGSLFGVSRSGPIESWVPMMMFAVLFGLSMDYEVFLLSRIREEYEHTRDNASAVADGLARTARVITAAAAIMIAVFFSFVLGDLRVLKLLGLGLSTAVLVDATVVRMVLVPATMELLGDANWWLPKWLDRKLPQLHVEGAPAPAGAVPPVRTR
ncbi:MAG TPA: MMPL family transporter [Acidimicrobiales bacterium]|nr:MMPL family transporter [Acidimicrobiales bacterium]